MTNQRNIIKWHFVTEYHTGRATGLRGWDDRLGERYEMTQTDDPLVWRVCVVVIADDDTPHYPQIHAGGVLDCIVAAEKVADKRYAQTEEMEEWD